MATTEKTGVTKTTSSWAGASRFGLVVAAVVLLATALRLPGLFTDFWLDEVWTLKIVLGMDSMWDVFTEIRHSNNHHLNTLFFYALGDREAWSLYRLHSLAAGVASVWLAAVIGGRHGRTEGVAAALLCATSYLLIHFSSEARGYAPVVFFALASLALLQDFGALRSWSRTALFWLCVCAGFLSHLMYLHVFAAAGVSMAVALWRRERDLRRAAQGLARLFAPPGLFLACFYWFDVRLTKIGAGPELETFEVFVHALSIAVGGPATGLLAGRIALATLALFGGAVVWWALRGRDEWVFLLVVIFVSPALSFWLMRPDVFFVRYFLLSTVFGLVALAGPMAAACARGGVPRIVAATAFAAMLLGNGILTQRFYAYGRGDYLETMRYIAASTQHPPPTVAGDHRFRNHNVIRFYNRYLPEAHRLVYVPQDQYPEWLLLHRIGPLGRVDQKLTDAQGHRYELARVAPYSDLSGWHWLVYHKQDPRHDHRQDLRQDLEQDRPEDRRADPRQDAG
jgi:hypothetical protein